MLGRRVRLPRWIQFRPHELAALLLAALFFAAAVTKALRFADFLQVLWAFGWLPRVLVAPAGAVVVALEATLAVGLALRGLRRPSAWMAVVALTGFAAVAGLALTQGLAVQCGCFMGLASREVGWALLVQNAALVVLAVWIARRSGSRDSARNPSSGALS